MVRIHSLHGRFVPTVPSSLCPQIVAERARLAQLRGDDTAASEQLQRAHALYVEIGATGHAQRLARALAGEDH